MSAVVVTGANRGIGLELCRQLCARGEQVIALVRRASPELEQLGLHIESGIDVSSDEVANLLRDRLAGVQVKLLINNAGILSNETLDDLDFDRIRRQFEVNSLGPLRVTSALLGKLQRGSKVAIVTSRMGSIADNTSGGRYGYRMSKASVNMAGVSLAHDLKERGIAVALLHPGFVRTGMTGRQGFIEADEAARGLLERIEDLTLENSGSFWHSNGELLPW